MNKATPNGCLVSGPGDFQIRMQAGGFSHYNIFYAQNVCYVLYEITLLHGGLLLQSEHRGYL